MLKTPEPWDDSFARSPSRITCGSGSGPPDAIYLSTPAGSKSARRSYNSRRRTTRTPGDNDQREKQNKNTNNQRERKKEEEEKKKQERNKQKLLWPRRNKQDRLDLSRINAMITHPQLTAEPFSVEPWQPHLSYLKKIETGVMNA